MPFSKSCPGYGSTLWNVSGTCIPDRSPIGVNPPPLGCKRAARRRFPRFPVVAKAVKMGRAHLSSGLQLAKRSIAHPFLPKHSTPCSPYTLPTNMAASCSLCVSSCMKSCFLKTQSIYFTSKCNNSKIKFR